MFRKILIANRGEIAVRIIRACREMGIRAATVYSEVDRRSLHVRMADEAYPIGPAAATESYLRIDKLIEAAKKCGAEALHPGYGFLAENPALARACREAGIVFIGPSAEVMELMGSKTASRQAVAAAGVAIVPGTREKLDSLDAAARVAQEYGYPVMLKAAEGGGGKGLRLVRLEREMASAYRDARAEASSAFGNDSIYVEKYLERPRHVEMQMLADHHGGIVCLGERECSVQRRHQKVMEESPSPLMTPELRQRMGAAALAVARAAQYTNAGTVEFLVDNKRNFYFLEMNTRLQVEHPVTELVTGVDLVKQQIRIAAGEKLKLQQQEIALRGHALECRIYAEDPENNFFPSPGHITRLAEPSGPGIRHDTGIYEGWIVPLEYDPIISKLVVWAREGRDEAIARMKRALGEYFIGGIKTNIPFFRLILEDPGFIAGNLDTEMVDRLLESLPSRSVATGSRERLGQVAALVAAVEELEAGSKDGLPPALSSRWKEEGRRMLLDRFPKR